MDLFFETEEDGIVIAQRTLDETKVSMRIRTASAAKDGESAIDEGYAPLQFQLDSLEEMLREATDARYAESLAAAEIHVQRLNEKDVNVESLRFVVATARELLLQSEALWSQDNPGFATSKSKELGGNGIANGIAGPSRAPITVGYVLQGSSRLPADVLSIDGGVIGRSTTSNKANAIPNCLRCLEPIALSADRLEAPCGHCFCTDCLIDFVTAHNGDESFHPLKCCAKPIPPRSVMGLLNNDLHAAFCSKLLEYYTSHDQRIYCPQPNCGRFIQLNANMPDSKTAACPTCFKSVCLKCKEAAHTGENDGENCEERRAAEQLRDIANTNGWKQCRCGFFIERISGCNYVVCTRCSWQFCYACGKQSAYGKCH